jgi:hypothetical protein
MWCNLRKRWRKNPIPKLKRSGFGDAKFNFCYRNSPTAIGGVFVGKSIVPSPASKLGNFLKHPLQKKQKNL